MFYSTRRMTANSEKRKFKLRKYVFYSILNMQMRFSRGTKFAAKNCELRFVLCFTIANAIAKFWKRKVRIKNANVSKPLRLCIKLTCRIRKGSNSKVKTTKLAETFMQNWRFGSQNVEKPPCLCIKSLVATCIAHSTWDFFSIWSALV